MNTHSWHPADDEIKLSMDPKNESEIARKTRSHINICDYCKARKGQISLTGSSKGVR